MREQLGHFEMAFEGHGSLLVMKVMEVMEVMSDGSDEK
jgi:hypothetical protein